MLGRRRGPSLLRAAATTAVVTSTAGAVRQKQSAQFAAQQQSQAAAAAPAPAPAGPAPDLVAELQKLAALKEAGALTDEEFTAAKARLLG